jgi:methylglutaconyl-CoA hydratase
MKFLKIETFINDSQIQVVTLSRPEVKNAFHPEMISEITETFKKLSVQKELKLVVLKGEGTSFCAGADLNWMKLMVNYSYEQNIQDSENLWDMFESIKNCSVPVVGVLHGAVFGGALGLAACCDYVIAEEKTSYCFSEVKLGLAPAVISSFVLRKVADGFARAMMLSAEVFNTSAALRMGLVHNSISNFETWTIEIKKFSVNGLEAMKATKKLLNQISEGLSWSEQKKRTTHVISERRVSVEAQERLKKFISRE